MQSLTHKLRLHQSDFGADLFECRNKQEAEVFQNMLASYGKTFCSSKELTDKSENQVVCTVDIETKDFDAREFDEKLTKKYENILYNPFHSAVNVSCIESQSILIDSEGPIFSNSQHCKATQESEIENSLVDHIFKSNNIETKEWECVKEYGLGIKRKMDLAWERYWSKYGECTIWASWIEKYADYINPEYLQNFRSPVEKNSKFIERNEQTLERFPEQNTCFPSEAHKNCKFNRSNFEGIFEKTENNIYELHKNESTRDINFSSENLPSHDISDREAGKNIKRIVNQCSPETDEGWESLSLFRLEESYNQPSSAEEEKIFTKCDSFSGFIAKTNATSDSMTNVTKVIFTSSSCDSASIASYSLVSSINSSNGSNVTSMGSDPNNYNTTEDNDKYWQDLWKEHFQEQYQKQYDQFKLKYKQKAERPSRICTTHFHENNKVVVSPELRIDRDKNGESSIRNQSLAHKSLETNDIKFGTTLNMQTENMIKKRIIVDSVGVLMQNLTMSSEQDFESDNDMNKNCLFENIAKDGESTLIYNATDSDNSYRNSIENKSEGLSIEKGDGRPCENKSIALKRRYYNSFL